MGKATLALLLLRPIFSRTCRGGPSTYGGLHPVRNRYGPHVSALADEVGDDPVLLSLLNRFYGERKQFATAKATADQHGDHRMIAHLPQCGRVGAFEQPPALFRR